MKEGPQVIFENKDFVVIDKPSGLMVHGVRVSSKRRVDEARAAEPTLVDWLIKKYPEIKSVGDDPSVRPGIVHRLDKATSGIMIVARTQASFEELKKLFADHKMRKTYFALVHGVPKNKKGVIDAPIGIVNGTLRRSVHSKKMAKEAITEYEVVKVIGDNALVRVSPRTGRTHQIRVHMTSIGHPLVGDTLYGKEKKDAQGERLMLHASALSFANNRGERFEFEAPLPSAFSRLSTEG